MAQSATTRKHQRLRRRTHDASPCVDTRRVCLPRGDDSSVFVRGGTLGGRALRQGERELPGRVDVPPDCRPMESFRGDRSAAVSVVAVLAQTRNSRDRREARRRSRQRKSAGA